MSAPHGRRPGTSYGRRQLSVLQIQQEQQQQKQQIQQRRQQARERFGISPMVNPLAGRSIDEVYDFSLSSSTTSALEKAAALKPPSIDSSKKAPGHRNASDPLTRSRTQPTPTPLNRNLNQTRKRQANDPLDRALRLQGQSGGGDVVAAPAHPSRYRPPQGAARSSSSGSFHAPAHRGRYRDPLLDATRRLQAPHQAHRKERGPLSKFISAAIADPYGFRTVAASNGATEQSRLNTPAARLADANSRRRLHRPPTPRPSSIADTTDSFSSGDITVSRETQIDLAPSSQESSHDTVPKRIPRKVTFKVKDVVDLCDGNNSDSGEASGDDDKSDTTQASIPQNLPNSKKSNPTDVDPHTDDVVGAAADLGETPFASTTTDADDAVDVDELLTSTEASGTNSNETTSTVEAVGRNETISILWHAAKNQFDLPECPGIEPNAPLDPISNLVVNGIEFCESSAILRFLANLMGLYPLDDPFKALLVDETLNIVNECMANYIACTEKSTFQTTVLAKCAGQVESYIQQFDKTNNTVLGIPTVVDVDLMTWVHSIQSGFFDHIDKEFFKDYPSITSCVKATEERGIVKAYFASMEML